MRANASALVRATFGLGPQASASARTGSLAWFSPGYVTPAGVAKSVDARDLKSLGEQSPCRFESCPRHYGEPDHVVIEYEPDDGVIE